MTLRLRTRSVRGCRGAHVRGPGSYPPRRRPGTSAWIDREVVTTNHQTLIAVAVAVAVAVAGATLALAFPATGKAQWTDPGGTWPLRVPASLLAQPVVQTPPAIPAEVVPTTVESLAPEVEPTVEAVQPTPGSRGRGGSADGGGRDPAAGS